MGAINCGLITAGSVVFQLCPEIGTSQRMQWGCAEVGVFVSQGLRGAADWWSHSHGHCCVCGCPQCWQCVCLQQANLCAPRLLAKHRSATYKQSSWEGIV